MSVLKRVENGIVIPESNTKAGVTEILSDDELDILWYNGKIKVFIEKIDGSIADLNRAVAISQIYNNRSFKD